MQLYIVDNNCIYFVLFLTRKSSQLNLNFCRPDHVFLMYANDLFLKQLTFLIDKSVETMDKLRSIFLLLLHYDQFMKLIILITDTLSFPFNYIASIVLVFLIGYIVKWTFKYILSPRAWIGVWQQRDYAVNRGAIPTSTGTAHHQDRISGENLRMFLNAISGTKSSNQITISNTTATAALTQAAEQGSGVQEILASLENGCADMAVESSMSEETAKSKENSPQKQTAKINNNDAAENQQDVSKSVNKPQEVTEKQHGTPKAVDKSHEVKLEDVLDNEA